MIIDIDYLKNHVVNNDLYNLIIDSSNNDSITRKINIVENKIKLYIGLEQFKNTETNLYEFPDEIKDVARYLVESLFLMEKDGSNTTRGKVISESTKFDDYSESKTYDNASILFYDIPILPEYLQVLEIFRPSNPSRFGHFNINID